MKRDERNYQKDLDRLLYKKISFPTENSKINSECKIWIINKNFSGGNRSKKRRNKKDKTKFHRFR